MMCFPACAHDIRATSELNFGKLKVQLASLDACNTVRKVRRSLCKKTVEVDDKDGTLGKSINGVPMHTMIELC